MTPNPRDHLTAASIALAESLTQLYNAQAAMKDKLFKDDLENVNRIINQVFQTQRELGATIELL